MKGYNNQYKYIENLLQQRSIIIDALSKGVSCCLFNLTNVLDSENYILSSLLHNDEFKRYSQFAFPNLAISFALCRILVRAKLSQILDLSFDRIRFSYNRFGRPFIACKKIDFNVSHTKNFGVICWSFEGRIGIDIEYTDLHFNYNHILNNFATLEEINWVNEKNCLARFYKLWTTKEAILKCKGTGLFDTFPKLNFHDEDLIYPGRDISTVELFSNYFLSLCYKKTFIM